MKKIVLKMSYFCLMFVSLLSLFSFINVSNIQASSEVVYGQVSIDEIFHFNLTYGISPTTRIAPGSLGQMGRDTKSAFAFNLPDNIETIVSVFEEVTVRYKVCETPIISFSSGFYTCLKQSDEFSIETLNINGKIDTYYNKHFLDWLFGGKRTATPIAQVGLVSELKNYADKDKKTKSRSNPAFLWPSG